MSEHEQTNGKPDLNPAEFRSALEGIIQAAGDLLAQLNGRDEVNMNGTGDRMLTVDEVAERLGLSRDTVYHRARQWPFTRKLGHRTLRFSALGLERWCSERTEEALQESEKV